MKLDYQNCAIKTRVPLGSLMSGTKMINLFEKYSFNINTRRPEFDANLSIGNFEFYPAEKEEFINFAKHLKKSLKRKKNNIDDYHQFFGCLSIATVNIPHSSYCIMLTFAYQKEFTKEQFIKNVFLTKCGAKTLSSALKSTLEKITL